MDLSKNQAEVLKKLLVRGPQLTSTFNSNTTKSLYAREYIQDDLSSVGFSVRVKITDLGERSLRQFWNGNGARHATED